jgi:tungstate transport system substrate-binding protein
MNRDVRRASRWWIVACLLWAAIACGRPPAADHLVLATTTSVANSGLLDVLVRAFEQQGGPAVRSHLVGSGLALGMLARGDADAAISHAPAAETAALRDHPAWHYRKIMFNHFVIVGPPTDPAGVRQAGGAADAMRRIAGSSSLFLSRGDRSGTHEREEQLWTAAAAKPPDGQLVIAGAGMGSTLRIAAERGAYTLTDTATFLQHAPAVDLAILFEGGPDLLNTYAVVVPDAGARAAAARAFADWLSDGAGRVAIRDHRIDGKEAFSIWPAGRPRSQPQDRP